MKFNVDDPKVKRAAETKRLSDWHEHFALVPRRVGTSLYWLETIQRKGEWVSRRRPSVGGFIVTRWGWKWEYNHAPMDTMLWPGM